MSEAELSNLPTYFDVHSHLNFPDYGDELSEIIKRMKEAGVWTICIGTNFKDSQVAVELAEKHEGIFACVGIHPIKEDLPKDSPWELESKGSPWDFNETELEKLVNHPKVVAVGECGLDYFSAPGGPASGGGGLSEGEKDRQRDLFKKQIEFALKHDKPLMIHARSAYDEIIEILFEYKRKELEDSPWELKLKGSPRDPGLRGNIHFFTGNLEQAKKFIDLGFTLSFAGPITFARDYDEVIKNIPIESILSETDSPFVAPAPYRGKRNEPSYVIEIVKKLAEIREENEEVFQKQLVANALELFQIKP
ncbi:MAG TPA: TatD family hydrolase [Candidatus Paceibacterota bacterium]